MGFLFFGKKKKKQQHQAKAISSEQINSKQASNTSRTTDTKPKNDVKEVKEQQPKENITQEKDNNINKSEKTKNENVEQTKTENVEERKTKVLHVTPHPEGGWQIKGNNHKKALKRFETQALAIEEAKAMAESRGISYMIHKKDGRIRKKRYDK